MSRKLQRGILGYKKDPKNQILFSFNVREGEEWPSDDSDDSDYLPDDQDDQKVKNNSLTANKTRQRNVHNKERKRKRDRTEKHESFSSKKNKHMLDKGVDVASLPPEIWLKIFGFVVRSIGSLPFLCRAARVCSLWHQLSCHTSLWEKVDLSYGWIKAQDQTLQWLCNNRLSQCRGINLTSWKNVSSPVIKQLGDHCPLLESVNLSYCKKLGSDAVVTLVDLCPRLMEIDLAFTSPDAVSPACLKHVVEVVAARLRLLNIGGNNLKAFGSVLNSLMEKCPNLEHLDISNAIFSSDFVSLKIEKLQTCCKKLRVICFANSKFRANSATQMEKLESPGFPDLEQLSVAVSTTTMTGMNIGLGINDDFIQRMLVTSTKLRLLDLRGCGNLTCAGLLTLPVTHLQQLYVSQSPIAKSNAYQDFEPLIKKWQHSLTDVDLSWNSYPSDILDVALTALVDCPVSSPLQSINLSGTSVSIKSIKYILQNCSNLTSVNLTSCRGLPRGIKRDFSGKQFLQLQRDLETCSDNSESDGDI